MFISYSRKDTETANKICRALDTAGISYFIDRQIGGAMEFPEVLANAIINSRLFLLLASENAYASKFTNNEVTFAFNRKPKNSILPYIIDNSELPLPLQLIFASINWRDIEHHPIDTVLVKDLCKLLGRSEPDPQTEKPTVKNGISLLAELNDGRTMAYIRGNVYLDSIQVGNMHFEEFLLKHGDELLLTQPYCMAYSTAEDYLDIITLIYDNPKNLKLLSEADYLALALSINLKSEEEYDSKDRSYVHRMEYLGKEAFFSFGDGLCEMESDQATIHSPKTYAEGRTFMIEDGKKMAELLLSGMTMEHNILTGKLKDTLLLSAIPFDIHFGPIWGETVPKIIDKVTTIPSRNSGEFDFAATEELGFRIAGKTWRLRIEDILGHIPKQVECTVFLGSSHDQVSFRVKDTETSQEKEISLIQLIRNEEN